MTDETQRIREALHHIPADDSDTWVMMAMAVKSELGDDGFDVRHKPAHMLMTRVGCR